MKVTDFYAMPMISIARYLALEGLTSKVLRCTWLDFGRNVINYRIGATVL